MIRFEDIHVRFNVNTPMETRALNGIKTEISEGEFVTVIGSNGAGKSTLLNVLTGNIKPYHGKVIVDGVDITSWSTPERANLVARVFQDPLIGTCADLTIEENFALAMRRGQSRGLKSAITPQLRAHFKEVISVLGLGLENRLQEPIGLLSGGQRQTLSLMMAVLSPMKILVLDEHTAALDPKMADYVIKLTSKVIKERNLTVLMVTHSMHQALNVGSRTIMLHQGNIAFDLKGSERKNLSVPDLLEKFKTAVGSEADDDSLVLV
jgi:putative ABC transport system ATP-binding protein